MKNYILHPLFFLLTVLVGIFLSAYLPRIGIKVVIEPRDRPLAQALNFNDSRKRKSGCNITLKYESNGITDINQKIHYLP